MKINSNNAQYYINHCAALALLAGVEKHEGSSIYEYLVKLEAKAHRIAENECNIADYDDKGQTEKINLAVGKIFNKSQLLSGFFINGDPRGYALKIKEDSVKELREHGITLYTDFGGYGILAPEF